MMVVLRLVRSGCRNVDVLSKSQCEYVFVSGYYVALVRQLVNTEVIVYKVVSHRKRSVFVLLYVAVTLFSLVSLIHVGISTK